MVVVLVGVDMTGETLVVVMVVLVGDDITGVTKVEGVVSLGT